MDISSYTKELEQIEIQLRDANLRERKALLSGYITGVKAAEDEAKKEIETLKETIKKLESDIAKKPVGK